MLNRLALLFSSVNTLGLVFVCFQENDVNDSNLLPKKKTLNLLSISMALICFIWWFYTKMGQVNFSKTELNWWPFCRQRKPIHSNNCFSFVCFFVYLFAVQNIFPPRKFETEPWQQLTFYCVSVSNVKNK